MLQSRRTPRLGAQVYCGYCTLLELAPLVPLILVDLDISLTTESAPLGNIFVLAKDIKMQRRVLSSSQDRIE